MKFGWNYSFSVFGPVVLNRTDKLVVLAMFVIFVGVFLDPWHGGNCWILSELLCKMLSVVIDGLVSAGLFMAASALPSLAGMACSRHARRQSTRTFLHRIAPLWHKAQCLFFT